MPGAVLNPVRGFWGKLPSRGDFTGRGLPDTFRQRWDRWATAHLAARGDWPEGGLRLRIAAGSRGAVGLALPSVDAVGRHFPLALFLIADDLPDPRDLDPWCEAALRVADEPDPDTLLRTLEAVPLPRTRPAAETQPSAMLLLWRRDIEAIAAPPDAPQPALDLLFSSG